MRIIRKTRRALLFTLALTALLPVALAEDLSFLDVEELQRRMQAGELTAVALTEHHMKRIAEIDDAGPTLNAVIEINPEALLIARRLDGERADGKLRGPLHGIPVVLKANIDTGDKMATTAGSLALAGRHAPDDAFHVQALRDAGLVILGKANLSEWANFRSTRSSSGWSGIGGQTKNPYFLDRNPCGSSSGSAVSVSAGLSVLAVGTETDGSIVCPAGINGIVGIKPTLGLVSRDGIIPIAHTQDTAGPMGRSVRDAALLLTAMARKDTADPAATDHPGEQDYAAGLRVDALKGARIGVWRGYYGSEGNGRVTEIFESTLAAMRLLGATLVDPAGLKLPDSAGDAEHEVLLYEFKADLNRYLAEGGVAEELDTLDEIIAFNEAHAETSMRWFGQEIMLMAEGKGPLTDSAYLKAVRKSQNAVRRAIDRAMSKHDLDAIIAPTNSPAWQTDYVGGDRFSLSSSSAAAVSGYPSVTLPAGEILGLPIGVSIFGAPHSEMKLIGYAYALEQVRAARIIPGLVPSLEN